MCSLRLFKPNPFSVNLPSRNSKSKRKALPTGALQLDGKVRKRINWVLNSCNCIVMQHGLERSAAAGCQLVWSWDCSRESFLQERKIVGPSCTVCSIDWQELPLCSLWKHELFPLRAAFFSFFTAMQKQWKMWKATELPNTAQSTSWGSFPIPERRDGKIWWQSLLQIRVQSKLSIKKAYQHTRFLGALLNADHLQMPSEPCTEISKVPRP